MILDHTVAQKAILDPSIRLADYAQITPEAAEVLARGYRQAKVEPVRLIVPTAVTLYTLDLAGLKDLDPGTAATLAGWNPIAERDRGDETVCSLLLDGVQNPSAESLTALASWKASCASATLSLEGLRTLTTKQAKALSVWSGADLFNSLNLSGVEDLSDLATVELARWSGEELTLGLPALTVGVATALSTWRGHTLALPKLTQLDGDSAQALIRLTPEGQLETPANVTWECLSIGGPGRIGGITPKVADWITELRMVDVNVVLSPESEQAVQENSTYSSFKPKL
jgi:hypothetical protein